MLRTLLLVGLLAAPIVAKTQVTEIPVTDTKRHTVNMNGTLFPGWIVDSLGTNDDPELNEWEAAIVGAWLPSTIGSDNERVHVGFPTRFFDGAKRKQVNKSTFFAALIQAHNGSHVQITARSYSTVGDASRPRLFLIAWHDQIPSPKSRKRLTKRILSGL